MALSKKDKHVGQFFQDAKNRATKKGVPFTITLEYLREIATDECPVFLHKFEWGASGLGKGKTTGLSPSLDRVIPELGYVEGNVLFISHDANRIKNNATERELYAVADWLHYARKVVLKNVAAQQSTSVSNPTDRPSKIYPPSGPVPTPRIRKDGNDFNHHLGPIYRIDPNYRPKARGGDSVGQRSEEMGASQTPTRLENNGDSEPEIIRLDFSSRHLSDKS
jgi:hypothetical protein